MEALKGARNNMGQIEIYGKGGIGKSLPCKT
jgi:hypothetical protein